MSYKAIKNNDVVLLVILLGATQEQVENLRSKLIKELKLKSDSQIMLTGERLMTYTKKYKDFNIEEFRQFLRLFRLVEE